MPLCFVFAPGVASWFRDEHDRVPALPGPPMAGSKLSAIASTRTPLCKDLTRGRSGRARGVADEGGVDELFEAHDEPAADDEVVRDPDCEGRAGSPV